MINNFEIKMVKFFRRNRVIDTHIGILWFHMWIRILASYHNWFYLFYFVVQRVIDIEVTYHPRPSDYPRIVFVVKLFGRGFDTGKKAAKIISEKVSKYMANKKSNTCDVCGGSKECCNHDH